MSESQHDVIFSSLADIGSTPQGRDCLAYSVNEDLAHARAAEILNGIGCEVTTDNAKNLYGTWYPNEASRLQKAVAAGSHLDSVPQGGRYDGVLGVSSAIEALRRIATGENSHLIHPIQVIAFRAEESSRFKQFGIGSGIATGVLNAEKISKLKDETGTSFLAAAGLQESDISKLLAERRVSPEALAAYIELHIEQSSVIEAYNQQHSDNPAIGIVAGGIGGAYRSRITLTGTSFHSGGLPMEFRTDRDMAVAAAEIILAVRRFAERMDTPATPLRATVNIENLPGKAVNSGSGKECLLLDMRAIEEGFFRTQIDAVKTIVREVVGRYDANVTIDDLSLGLPTPFGSDIPHLLEDSARTVGVPFINLPSMPGQDAANVAKAGVPVGMIFVESRAGESHNHTEYTSSEQMELGVQVLTQALITAASR